MTNGIFCSQSTALLTLNRVIVLLLLSIVLLLLSIVLLLLSIILLLLPIVLLLLSIVLLLLSIVLLLLSTVLLLLYLPPQKAFGALLLKSWQVFPVGMGCGKRNINIQACEKYVAKININSE